MQFRRDNQRTCWRRKDNIFAKLCTYSRTDHRHYCGNVCRRMRRHSPRPAAAIFAKPRRLHIFTVRRQYIARSSRIYSNYIQVIISLICQHENIRYPLTLFARTIAKVNVVFHFTVLIDRADPFRKLSFAITSQLYGLRKEAKIAKRWAAVGGVIITWNN